MHIQNARIGQSMRKSALWFYAAVLAGASVLPFLMVGSASAATVQLTNRSAAVTNAIPSTAFDITFEFNTPTNASEDIEAIEFEFTDDPLAAYNSDTLANTPSGTATYSAQSGFAQATAFADSAFTVGRNATGGTATNQLLVTRTEVGSESANTNASVTLTGLTHNATANTTFYIRMRMFNSNTVQDATTLVWEGAVAQSTSQTLNVSARVQERLEFCVGSTAVDNATTSPGADCTAITGNNVDLGVVSNSLVNTSPVPTTSGGNATNGIAMVNTNAVNGTVVQYAAILESGISAPNGGGTLKIDAATCASLGSFIDQCFNSQGATKGAIAAGTENFGMTVAGTNCGSNDGTGYPCNFAAGNVNLQPQGQYVGDSFTNASAGSYGATGFAWVDDGTYTTIASTSGATATQVIDDEALILKFAATASATTPTGTYDVDIDYVATPTF